ncbi:hypothetical protein CAMGR0001_1832 [Campylobacter gracilis RM3268]|uniref:Uncharacterized protein n=1 Tax=Campylobacter gracilis RM3268 TaxID=553220 RepID=C8PED1_9BACT|nr:hypothetical protein CAMGR0001_1832 [Campylobacter gracilis RM3268]
MRQNQSKSEAKFFFAGGSYCCELFASGFEILKFTKRRRF